MFSFQDYVTMLTYITLSQIMYFLSVMWQFIVWSAAIMLVMWVVHFVIICARQGKWKQNSTK